MTWFSLSFPTFRRLYRWGQERLSAGGKAIVAALLWLLFTTINSETVEMPLLSACLAIIGVTWAANRMFWPRLKVRAKGPAQVMRGRSVPVTYEVANAGSLSTYDVSLQPAAEPDLWESAAGTMLQNEIASRGTVSLTAAVRPLKRGVWTWPGVQVSSSFPFNVWRTRQNVRTANEVAVYPQYDEDQLRQIEHALAQHAGREAVFAARASTGSDFFSNREYQPGMPVRRWNYGAWARLGQPIVREFQEPCSQRAAVYVDTDLAGEALEDLLSNAAALCDHLLAERWSLDLLVLGTTTVGNTLDPLALSDVLEALARATSESARGGESWSLRLSADHVTFLLFSQWDERRAALVRTVAKNCGEVVALRLEAGGLQLLTHLASSEVRP
jgi:uncharacterized protein (DUF58 family)